MLAYDWITLKTNTKKLIQQKMMKKDKMNYSPVFFIFIENV